MLGGGERGSRKALDRPLNGCGLKSLYQQPRSQPDYCTLALTDALPFSVKVQVLVFWPPLEQAPDQIASRPFVTLSVIDVPIVNDAEPVPGTATLMPVGLERTRSPLRPLADTVNVAVPPGGGGPLIKAPRDVHPRA